MTSSQNFSMAPVSLTCARPLASTILAGDSPVANISAKTVWAMLLLILPLSTRAASSAMSVGLILVSARAVLVSVSFARKLLMIQLATALGFFAPATAFSK